MSSLVFVSLPCLKLIQIQNPDPDLDHSQNVNICSLMWGRYSQNISWKSIQEFPGYAIVWKSQSDLDHHRALIPLSWPHVGDTYPNLHKSSLCWVPHRCWSDNLKGTMMSVKDKTLNMCSSCNRRPETEQTQVVSSFHLIVIYFSNSACRWVESGSSNTAACAVREFKCHKVS